MKIIDAFWEKRNLELDVLEILIDYEDVKNLNELSKKIDDLPQNNYIVLKSPVAQVELLQILQDKGFCFLETRFDISKKITDYNVPKLFTRITERVNIIEAPKSKEEWDSAINSVEEDMYSTDRIYLDPKLSKNMATSRYKNWMKDLYEKDNSFLYYIKNKNDDTNLGFGIYLTEPNSSINSILAGIYKQYQNYGIGSMIIHGPIVLAKEKGIKNVFASICSNNLPVVRLYSYFGFVVDNLQYVLRRFPK